MLLLIYRGVWKTYIQIMHIKYAMRGMYVIYNIIYNGMKKLSLLVGYRNMIFSAFLNHDIFSPTNYKTYEGCEL